MTPISPITNLRNLMASACKLDPYFMDQFDSWVAKHVKPISCTYTVREEPGPPPHWIEKLLRDKISHSIFIDMKKETLLYWGQPPHTETTMTVEVIS